MSDTLILGTREGTLFPDRTAWGWSARPVAHAGPSYIVDERGRLRRHVNIFVGEEPIVDRAWPPDEVKPDGRPFILQALSGG